MRLKSKAIFWGKKLCKYAMETKIFSISIYHLCSLLPSRKDIILYWKKKKCWIGLRCKRDIKQRKGLREGAVDQKGHMLTLKNSLEACVAVLQTGDLKKPQRVV